MILITWHLNIYLRNSIGGVSNAPVARRRPGANRVGHADANWTRVPKPHQERRRKGRSNPLTSFHFRSNGLRCVKGVDFKTFRGGRTQFTKLFSNSQLHPKSAHFVTFFAEVAPAAGRNLGLDPTRAENPARTISYSGKLSDTRYSLLQVIPIPRSRRRFGRAASVLSGLGADVTLRRHRGLPPTVSRGELEHPRASCGFSPNGLLVRQGAAPRRSGESHAGRGDDARMAVNDAKGRKERKETNSKGTKRADRVVGS
jgi:hypothetical protein